MNEYDLLDTAPLPDPEPGFPWPPAESESIATAFADTWRGAALEPAAFFRAMPREAGIGPALLYYLPLGIAVAGATLFWTLVGGGALGGGLLDGFGGPGAPESNPLVDFLMSPLILLLSIFLSAGVSHLMLKMLGGANRPVGTTVRVFAYAYSPQILGVIPWVGQLVGGLWMVVIAIIGLREAHGTSGMRAAIAILVPLAFAVFFVILSLLILATTTALMPL
ncbi:MAG TPA: Yip1 family protein [Longimicrobiales bacterium]|nr:Yip1 family protein [Longimicrobiales bacterium]